MMHEKNIACLLTPSGSGGIAVIQLSGPDAHVLLQQEFHGTSTNRTKSGRVYYGHLYDDTTLLDEVLLGVYSTAHSPTGAPTVEINCHGGIATTEAILALLESKGVLRLSQQQYLDYLCDQNSSTKIEIQALQFLLASKTELAARVCTYQLNGELSRCLQAVGELLPKQAATALKQLRRLLTSYELGQALVSPQTIVIAGRPNAGKSTLLNLLLGRERVLVDATPGTTRDAIAALIAIEGIPFVLFDTAGIRDNPGFIEKLGIEVAKNKIHQADYVLWLFDVTQPPEDIPEEVAAAKNLLIGLNKVDIAENYIPQYRQQYPQAIALSALTGDGVRRLEQQFIGHLQPLISGDPFAVILAEDTFIQLQHVVSAIEHGAAIAAKTMLAELAKSK